MTSISKDTHYHALPIGTRLHEFQIEDVLGSGGFGITYKARDLHLDNVVAIKEFLPNVMAVRTTDATVRARSSSDDGDFAAGLGAFLDEARVLARFQHRSINRVLRFFEMHGTAYIVLHYEAGETLGRQLDQGGAYRSHARRMLLDLIDGLEVVHDRGVLHRDLKPNNIILRDDGTPVMIDFGAARDFTTRNSLSLTSIVTPGYSPPEQYGTGGEQGPWTDFYALGAIAYRCVTGKAPPDSLRRMIRDPIVPTIEAAPEGFDPPLLRAIDWMLAINEASRPQSAEALRKAIDGGDAKQTWIKPGQRRKPEAQDYRAEELGHAAVAGALASIPKSPDAGVLARARRFASCEGASRRGTVARFAAAGLVTGLMTFVSQIVLVDVWVAIKETFLVAGLQAIFGDAAVLTTTLIDAVPFGLLCAWLNILYGRRRASFAILIIASSMVGLFCASLLVFWNISRLGVFPGEHGMIMAASGALSGLVGGLIVVVALSIASRRLRDHRPWVSSLGVAVLGGTLLAIPQQLVLFCVWQGALAAVLTFFMWLPGTGPTSDAGRLP